MTSDQTFRLATMAIFVFSLVTAGYYRRRATLRGERVSREDEGWALFLAIRFSGLVLFLTALAYLIHPAWIGWAQLSVPTPVRWIGAALGVLGVLLVQLTLQALGDNLTDTVAVRRQHTLVTWGPYRWVRHPYYVAMLLLVTSVALLAANWFLAISGLAVFLLLVARIPREERHLVERFGDAYRNYQQSTGGLMPRSLLAAIPMSGRYGQVTRRIWVILRGAVNRFLQIDGTLWAGAFAFNAFFSLFPLIILVVTIASLFVDREKAAIAIISHMEQYVPISGEMQSYIFDTIAGVVNARRQAGIVAFLMLVWVAIQCFTTLISATNRARDDSMYSWWRLPLTSLFLFSVVLVAVLLGLALPLLAAVAWDWLFPLNPFHGWVYRLGSFLIKLLIVFVSLSLLYKFAPRRATTFSEVWLGALVASLLLRISEGLFVIYLTNYATLNAVYGAFGGIMALLLWIYLAGCIVIFGACLCGALSDTRLSDRYSKLWTKKPTN